MHWQPMTVDDLKAIEPQPAQADMAHLLGDEAYARSLQEAGPCFALREGDEVLVCAGLVPLWPGRSQCWSVIGSAAGPHFVRIFRAMRAFLGMQDVRRIEMAVDCGFPEGHRLADMLGFRREGRMAAYSPDGRDFDLYARVS